mmetsp:Transcript_24854/g.42572  ORF Transcript_24854/g.42572 Transcript_24854/m.42572 type:complete len:87 (-) Transcript_24854:349-609(-)
MFHAQAQEPLLLYATTAAKVCEALAKPGQQRGPICPRSSPCFSSALFDESVTAEQASPHLQQGQSAPFTLGIVHRQTETETAPHTG